MEPLVGRSRRILATKISYISQIMIYFGFIHECAELYRQLCRDSREEWNSNSKAIFKVIMKNKDSRFRMLMKRSFNSKNADFLLKHGIYNYFSLGISIDQIRSYKSATYFIENLNEYAPFLFFEVCMIVRKCTYDIANKFVKVVLLSFNIKKAILFTFTWLCSASKLNIFVQTNYYLNYILSIY